MSSIQELTDEDIYEQLKRDIEDETNFLEFFNHYVMFLYEGFDAKVLLVVFARRGIAVGREWKSDLKKLATYGFLRGNQFSEKSAARTSKTGKDEIRSLQNIYKVVYKEPSGNATTMYGREEITFPRLVAIMSTYFARVLISTDLTPVAAISEDICPRYLQFSAGASICPDETALAKWMVWSTGFAKLINRYRPEALVDEVAIKTYARAQFESSYIPFTDRASLALLSATTKPEAKIKSSALVGVLKKVDGQVIHGMPIDGRFDQDKGKFEQMYEPTSTNMNIHDRTLANANKYDRQLGLFGISAFKESLEGSLITKVSAPRVFAALKMIAPDEDAFIYSATSEKYSPMKLRPTEKGAAS